MTLTPRPITPRTAGARLPQLLLAIALIAGTFGLSVVRAEPASAYTIQRSATEIVVTSKRMSDITVSATVSWILRSNGDITLRVNARNTGLTRKFFAAGGEVFSPAGGNIGYQNTIQRIPGDSTRTYEQTWWGTDVRDRFERLLNDPDLTARFDLDAHRTG